jgi:hypothetical protein
MLGSSEPNGSLYEIRHCRRSLGSLAAATCASTGNGLLLLKACTKSFQRFGSIEVLNIFRREIFFLKFKIWLWLIWHNSIATKDNMYKRGWRGDTKCRFCDEEDDIHRLFFLCPAARYMWIMVSVSIDTLDRPSNFTQCFSWIAKYARNLKNIHVVGVAALCWNFWKLRNGHVLRKKLITYLVEIIYYAF